MDSLLANYGSSDEEERGEEVHQPREADHPAQAPSRLATDSSVPSSSSFFSLIPAPKSSSSSASLFSSLPVPKSSSSSSLFSSLPPPKPYLTKPPQALMNQQESEEEDEEQQQRLLASKRLSEPTMKPSSSLFSSLPNPKSTASSSIFSSLPLPKPQNADAHAFFTNPSSDPNPRKVVQLKLPIMTSRIAEDEDDDDDDFKEREGEKPQDSSTQPVSAKSFISSILPAPKHSTTLGALPSASGKGRRSIIEADVQASNSNDLKAQSQVDIEHNLGNYEGQWTDGSSAATWGSSACSTENAVGGGGDASSWVPSGENYGASGRVSSGVNFENYGSYSGYDTFGNQGQYESNWTDASAANMVSAGPTMAESMVKLPRKRGRTEAPQEIVEVKQDELMKNRPREDQSKLTGIAFGPSYQPVSTKGKPSKLHKRKHQIGSLYFDMKQKETELAERRARGFLTKAETQGKYGW